MGTVLASAIIDRAAAPLQDAEHVRWPVPELLGWMHEAMCAIVVAVPSANATTQVLQLVKGTRQRLPAGGLQLLDVVRNVGAQDAPGRAVRIAQRAELDATAPTWHASKPDAVVRHYIPIEHDTKAFFVYPPNDGAGRIEALFSTTPEAPALGQAIGLDDIYQAPILDWVLYRAFAKDTEVADETKSRGHLTAFNTFLGIKPRSDAATSPKTTAPATRPAAR